MQSSLVIPSKQQVLSTVQLFDTDETTKLTDSALSLLFGHFPTNKDASVVLSKAATLNALYSTNIYGLTALANLIASSNIDAHLAAGNIEAVTSIQSLTINGRTRSIYSFATKYCSWHKPEIYPIFDSFVADMLLAYKRSSNFSSFTAVELRNYSIFVKVLNEFKNHYGLGTCSLKEVDKFLWWHGRAAKSGT